LEWEYQKDLRHLYDFPIASLERKAGFALAMLHMREAAKTVRAMMLLNIDQHALFVSNGALINQDRLRFLATFFAASPQYSNSAIEAGGKPTGNGPSN
jgi:hypothetical protein